MWNLEREQKMQEKCKLDIVSIRLVHEAPLLSEHRIDTPEDAIYVMGEALRGMDREVLCVINLKSDNTPINGHIASIGALNQTMAHPRELLKTTVLSNAASMIILHCHPSGELVPSQQDVEVTDRMINLCSLIGIPLLDHIIVGGDNQEYFSFRQKGIMKYSDLQLQTDYRRLEFEDVRSAEEDYVKEIGCKRENVHKKRR